MKSLWQPQRKRKKRLIVAFLFWARSYLRHHSEVKGSPVYTCRGLSAGVFVHCYFFEIFQLLKMCSFVQTYQNTVRWMLLAKRYSAVKFWLMPKDSSGLLRGNKKSILHKLRLHLVVVSLPAALIIIKGPFQCIFKGLAVEEHGGLWKKEQKKVPQSAGVDALIERNVTSLGFLNICIHLAGSDKTDRRKHFLA